ncbi:hypothetical protein GCM10027418_15320 [Mariniluteicoccus endophyticus]
MKVKVNAAAENTHTAAGTRAAMIADAKSRLSPLFDQGRDKLTPLVEDGLSKLAPFADEAKARGAEYAAQASEKLAPARAVAQQRYQELLPKLGDALEQLVNDENAQEAQHRGLAALAALRGDLALPKKEQKRLHKEQMRQVKALQKVAKKQEKGGFGSKLKTVTLFALLGGIGYFVYKQFFAAKSSSDWQAHNASSYKSTTTTPTTTPTTTQSFSEPVDAPQTEAGATVDRSKYGADAFVGAEPPAGYTIKGNERSMKYHTPDSGGYDRTIADVWFTTEAAAEKAGFSRAQR